MSRRLVSRRCPVSACVLVALAWAPSLGAQTPTLPFQDPALPIEERVDDLVARMTLEEKASQLYLDNESYDGCFRDRCVFRPAIDIEDTMNVLVTYDTGATLCYSVNALNSWEGYTIAFNGTKGRIEHKVEEQLYLSGDGSVQGAIRGEGAYTRVFPLREPAYEVDLWRGEGGDGGGAGQRSRLIAP
jgi:hypothetical protein